MTACPSNPAPPFGMVQWAGSPAAQAWARAVLPTMPAGSTAYGVVDGAHVAARVEYQMAGGTCMQGITLYRPIDVVMRDLATPAVAAPSVGVDGPTALQLAGFAFLAFSTAFGLTWAFVKGETPQ